MQNWYPGQPGTYGQPLGSPWGGPQNWGWQPMGGQMAGPQMWCGPNAMQMAPWAGQCPMCGYGGPTWQTGAAPSMAYAGFGGFPAPFFPASLGWGLGGLRKWGGTYSPQFAATGLPTDEEITEMVYDAIDADPLIPYDADINVDVNAGTVTLSGTVLNKTVKHAAGDDVWWIPGVTDVINNLSVSGRRRARSAPSEPPMGGQRAPSGTTRTKTTRRSR